MLQPGLRNVLDLTLVQPEIHPVGGWVRGMTELPVPARVGAKKRSKAPTKSSKAPAKRASKSSKSSTPKKKTPKKKSPNKKTSRRTKK